MRTLCRALIVSLFIPPLLSLAAISDAQTGSGTQIAWQQSAGNWTGKMMDVDRFDNVYVVGDTVVGDIVLTRKLDANGNLLWEKQYRPAERVRASWIAADPNGGAYVAGTKISGSQSYPIGYFVIRYDAFGNVAWTDISDGSAASTVRVESDEAGNGYVTGSLYEAGETIPSIGIVKYSPTLGRQWICSIFNPNGTGWPGTPLPTGLSVASNGSAVVAAGTSMYNWYALSCDLQTGAKHWQVFENTTIGGATGAAAAINSAGEVYLGGGLPGGAGMLVRKFNGSGSLLWAKTYTDGDYVNRLKLDSAGNIVVTGVDYGPGYGNWVTLKLSPAGTKLWSQKLDAMTTNDELPKFLAIDTADNIYVTGRGGPASSTGNVINIRMDTVKYSPDGERMWMTADAAGGDGVAVRVSADGQAIFVLGSLQMYTVAYGQTGLLDEVAAAPTALSAQAYVTGSSYTVILAWLDNSNNEFWFEVERCAGAGCTDFAIVGQTTGENTTSLQDRNLPGGSTFTYRVRAHGFMGGSSYSNVVSVRTGSVETAPAAPSNLKAAAVSDRQIGISWTNGSSGQSAVEIERCAGKGCTNFTQLAVVGGSATSYVDAAGLKPRTSYSYRVRASSTAGVSPYSNVASAQTKR